MNLRELKSGGFLASEETAHAVLDRNRETEKKMPWIARIALGFGAWLAGIFFTGFLGILLDFDEGLPVTIVGFLFAAGGVFLLRLGKGVFLDQLALALGFAGHLLFFFGLHDVHSNDLVGPFIGALILCGPVYWFSKHSVQRFLSVLWVWLTGWGAGVSDWRNAPDALPYLMFFGALAVALAVLSGWSKAAGPVWRPSMWASVVGLFGMLLWCSAGASLDFGHPQIGPIFGLVAAMAISGVLWNMARPEGRVAIGFGVFVFLLIGLGIAGAPGVVLCLGLMAIARVRNDRYLGWVALLGLGYFLIVFYYHLDISLIEKSIILMVSGAIFLGLRLWMFRIRASETPLADDRVSEPKKRLIQSVVIIANCVLVLGVVNGAIFNKQRVVDTGRTVFLELAPVDPRSLMQGDYMALGYALPREKEFGEAMGEAPTRGALVVKLDEKDVATFSRIADEETAIGEDEVLLSYRKWRRGWRFGIESFFFQEGLGQIYNSAKFAELRVSPDGKAVLVDLRGAKLERLAFGTQPDSPTDTVESVNQ